MLRLTIVLLLVCCSNVSARMYQWVDPDTGSTQLSGKPPMWYRSAESGPRIFVFEKNKIIDDTGIEVSSEERERLRQRAFLQADEDRERAKQKLLEAKRLDAALQQKQAALIEDEAPLEPIIEDVIDEIPEDEPPPSDEDSTLEQMRKLIADWEKAKTEEARGVLDQP